MPAATTKRELIAVAEKEFDKLGALIAPIGADQANLPDDEGTTIRDILIHRAYWIDLFLGWYADGAAGRPVQMPARGFGWGDLKALNARIRDEHQNREWDWAKGALNDAHDRFLRHLRRRSDHALYGAAMTGGNGKWTEGRYAESAGPSHYRSAAKYIRARQRAMTRPS